MNSCPEKSQLDQFLDESLANSDMEWIAEHIETCSTCQSTVESLLDGRSSSVLEMRANVSANDSVDQNTTNDSNASSSRTISAMQEIALHDSSAFPDAMDPSQTESIDSQLATSDQPVVFEGFRIIKRLGSGFSSVVYQAVDQKLDRVVALKLLHGLFDPLADGDSRAWREARASAALHHENIARLLQIGGESTTRPYLVLEFVDGNSVQEAINSAGVLPIPLAIKLLTQVCDGLQAAHDNNIVHRDIKPSNILIESSTDIPKIVDFGLAINPVDEQRLTREGWLAGTPAYMSPEQVFDPGAVDHRCDVYGLGVVMYEMLTGEVPFRGLAKSTLERIRTESPRSLRLLNRQVPRDLETICFKAIAKEPSHRYQSAAEFAKDLRRFDEGKPITARPISRFSAALRWSRRNKLVAGLSVVVAMLVAAIVFGSLLSAWQLSKTNAELISANAEADRSAQAASEQRDALMATVEELVFKVSDTAEEQYMEQDELQSEVLKTALEGLRGVMASELDQDEENISSSVTVERNRLGILLRLTVVLNRLGEYDEATSCLNRADQIAQQISSELPDDRRIQAQQVEIAWRRMEIALTNEQYRKSIRLGEAASALSRQFLEEDVSSKTKLVIVMGMNDFASLQDEENLLDQAIETTLNVLELCDSMRGETRMLSTDEGLNSDGLSLLFEQLAAHELLAEMYCEQENDVACGEQDLAAAELDRLLRVYSAGEESWSFDPDPNANLLAASVKVFQRCLKKQKINDRSWPEEVIDASDYVDDIVVAYTEMGKPDRAVEFAGRSVAMTRKALALSAHENEPRRNRQSKAKANNREKDFDDDPTDEMVMSDDYNHADYQMFLAQALMHLAQLKQAQNESSPDTKALIDEADSLLDAAFASDECDLRFYHEVTAMLRRFEDR